MNVWIKIALPFILGGGAAWINWFVLQSQLTPQYFVKVKQDMKAGDRFTQAKLDRLTIRTEDGPGSLDGSAVRWENRAVLYDAPCVRELKANDVVFLRDAPSRFKVVPLKKTERAVQISLDDVKYEPSLLMVGAQIGFVVDKAGPLTSDPVSAIGPNAKLAASRRSYAVIGPFRVLSVGRRVSPQAEGDGTDNLSARILSIAVQTEDVDGVEVMDDQANRLIQAASTSNSIRKSSIEAIVLYPGKD